LNQFITVCLCGLFWSLTASAQYRPWKYWEDKPGTWSVAFAAGATRYAGDLSEEKDILVRPRLGAETSVSVLYRFAERFSVRTDARMYTVWGKHQNTRIWFNNLSFIAINPELCAGLQADLFPADQRDRPINPYLFVGGGFTYLNILTRFQKHWVSLPPLHTENVVYNRYPPFLKIAVGHPLMVRFRYRLTAEVAYTALFSDYLDDVSTVYPDMSKLDPLGQALSDRRYSLGLGLPSAQAGDQRGNPARNDGYFSLSLRFIRQLSTEADTRYKRVIGW
jgi:hypothetical protein